MLRLLFIPSGTKDWVLGYLKTPSTVTIATAIVTHCIFAFEMAMAAKGLREGIKGNQSNHQRVAWGIWALANILATLGLGVWAKGQVDKYRNRKGNENDMQLNEKG